MISVTCCINVDTTKTHQQQVVTVFQVALNLKFFCLVKYLNVLAVKLFFHIFNLLIFYIRL